MVATKLQCVSYFIVTKGESKIYFVSVRLNDWSILGLTLSCWWSCASSHGARFVNLAFGHIARLHRAQFVNRAFGHRASSHWVRFVYRGFVYRASFHRARFVNRALVHRDSLHRARFVYLDLWMVAINCGFLATALLADGCYQWAIVRMYWQIGAIKLRFTRCLILLIVIKLQFSATMCWGMVATNLRPLFTVQTFTEHVVNRAFVHRAGFHWVRFVYRTFFRRASYLQQRVQTIVARNELLAWYLVLANSCYRFAAFCSTVLAHGRYQFVLIQYLALVNVAINLQPPGVMQ